MQTVLYSAETPMAVVSCGSTYPQTIISNGTYVLPRRRYAFLKDFGERGWLVVIVVQAAEGVGEVETFNGYFATEADACEWSRSQIGELETVYTDPNWKR